MSLAGLYLVKSAGPLSWSTAAGYVLDQIARFGFLGKGGVFMLQKFKKGLMEFVHSVEAKVGALGGVAVSMLSVGASASGGGATTTVGVSDIQPVLTALEGQISVSTVVAVLAAGAGIAVGFAFMWWAGRKLVRMLMSAFKKGRVSV